MMRRRETKARKFRGRERESHLIGRDSSNEFKELREPTNLPALWSILALIVIIRVPFYKHWSSELRAALPFLASMIFMLAACLFEVLSVRSITAVLGLDWHRCEFGEGSGKARESIQQEKEREESAPEEGEINGFGEKEAMEDLEDLDFV